MKDFCLAFFLFRRVHLNLREKSIKINRRSRLSCLSPISTIQMVNTNFKYCILTTIKMMNLPVWHTDCAYLLPHFDKEKLSGKVESDVCVISIIPNVRDGDVQRDVLHSSQSQIRSPVINTAEKEQQINSWLFILFFKNFTVE